MRLPHFLLIPALLISGAVVSMADSGDSEARREEIIGRLRDRLRGGDAEVTDEEIVSLVTAGQRSVTVNAIRNTPTGGTIVEVVEDRTGRLPALSGRLVIDALKLPVGSRWQGIIYPAGVKLRQPGESPLAVFCGSAESAAELLSRYLDIYSEFAEQGGAANASPRAENGSDNAVEGIDFKRGNSVTVYADEDGYSNYIGYYLGGSYYPVWWYWGGYAPPWQPPRPPRPDWNHPPRPPRPRPPEWNPPRPPRPPQRPDVRPQPRPEVRPGAGLGVGSRPAGGATGGRPSVGIRPGRR